MQFEYLYEVKANGVIDIDDIGNTVLSTVNVLTAEEYILVISTEYGRTKTLQYGPLFVDMEGTPLEVSCYYSEFDYSMYKIEKLIDKFLNNPKRNISQVIEKDIDYAKERIKDMRTFI